MNCCSSNWLQLQPVADNQPIQHYGYTTWTAKHIASHCTHSASQHTSAQLHFPNPLIPACVTQVSQHKGLSAMKQPMGQRRLSPAAA
jgi:hypothetical protein